MNDTPYVPKVGEEVEVVLRGKVTSAQFDIDEFSVGGHPIYGMCGSVVSVTRVRKPLPTAPDTVIAYETQRYILFSDGWRCVLGNTRVDPDWLDTQDWRIVSVPVQGGEVK